MKKAKEVEKEVRVVNAPCNIKIVYANKEKLESIQCLAKAIENLAIALRSDNTQVSVYNNVITGSNADGIRIQSLADKPVVENE